MCLMDYMAFKNARTTFFLKSDGTGITFRSGSKKNLEVACPDPYPIRRPLPQKAHWECFNVWPFFQVWNGLPKTPTPFSLPSHNVDGLTMAKKQSNQCIQISMTQFFYRPKPKDLSWSPPVHNKKIWWTTTTHILLLLSINSFTAMQSLPTNALWRVREACPKSVASLEWAPWVWVLCGKVVDLTTHTTCCEEIGWGDKILLLIILCPIP